MTSDPKQSAVLYTQAKIFLSDMDNDPRFHMGVTRRDLRLQEIEREIGEKGTYTHTEAELKFGVQWAWRNSNRCIGRHMWRTLQVRDCRHIEDRDGVIEALHDHLTSAWQGGDIQSVISVFPPRQPGEPLRPDKVRIANHQLLRYAGFEQEDGQVVGDPHSRVFTARMLEKGWVPQRRGPYTPLPWSIWIHDEETAPADHFAAHPHLFPEIKITHPEYPGIGALGLRWYALPVISEMALVIGGITYPCAPFNGWYMGTEIANRNFCDAGRYNLLQSIAIAMGLDTSSNRTLWKDQALTAINQAVLHSFDAAHVRIGDHHELGAQFERFCEIEESAGRRLNGDWSWLTPPISGSVSPQFHREFNNAVESHTNFFYQRSPLEDVAARQSTATDEITVRSDDPFHLEHQHETPKCPYGFDRLSKVLPFKRRAPRRIGGHN